MKEYLEFLGEQEPYSRLEPADLNRLAHQVEVEYFTAGTEVVRAGGPVMEHVYVIRTGSVEMVDREHTVDVLGPGDTFGHISVFTGVRPTLAVRCIEDTLCYRLPDPRALVEHPERLQFAHYGRLIARERLIATERSGYNRFDRPLREVQRPITWCYPDTTIREVATRMTEEGASCAVYIRDGQPGIVTDADFREKVGTGRATIDTAVARIGSHPAFVVADDLPVESALITMVDRGIHHLLTNDRTGRPTGVIRLVDMADSSVRNPLLVRSATDAARNFGELVVAARQLTPTLLELFDAGLSPHHFGAVHSAMVESVFRRIVDFHTPGTVLEQLDCSWMLLGSIGRRETLPNSDVDTALAWVPAEGAPAPDPTDVVEAVMPIMKAMPACGLEPCPQGLNAVNRQFNHPARAWPAVIAGWRQPPYSPEQLLPASTMLDARAITHATLTHALREELLFGRRRSEFVASMNALAMSTRPPSGFVREFVVERLGGRKAHLNLKKAGLRPIASLARALALRAGAARGSTPERLDTAHRFGLISADETDSLKGAFDLSYYLSIESQVTAIREDRPITSAIAPDQLSTLDRRHLRDAFRTVNQIQDRLQHQPVWGTRP